jgi:hypothetical protein
LILDETNGETNDYTRDAHTLASDNLVSRSRDTQANARL